MTIVDTATRYLDALISHDADSVPLTDDVRRITNGTPAVEGADELREIIRREPVVTTHGFRWLTDGDDAVVFYDLDAARTETAMLADFRAHYRRLPFANMRG